ncbi:MAG TPA: DUF6438 domain-containing protein [Chitinophagales bacterium]|nr:DUF6438 domain-containing protein [Chitinophagales bacterium]
MKYYLFTFFLLSLLSPLSAQNKMELNKIWISSDLEYLDLRKSDTAYFDYGSSRLEKYVFEKKYSVFQLIQFNKYLGVNKLEKKVISYKIEKLTADTLIIRPLTKYSKVFVENEDKSYATKYHVNPKYVELNNNDTYVFVDKSIIHDKHLIFDKLFFSSSSCLGSCPSMEIEIDSIGNISFNGRMHTGAYNGNYFGKLPKEKLETLIEILKSSSLENIPTTLGGGIDSPNYNLIVSYNNQIKEITGGFLYPYFNKPLFEYLLNIFEEVDLTKTEKLNFILPNKSPNR